MICFMGGFPLMELFEPHENRQKSFRILDPEFRGPGRILDISSQNFGVIKDGIETIVKGGTLTQ